MQQALGQYHKPKVSVIVPCRNEKNHISGCLNSIMRNDYENKEILVVDGLSDDGTRDIIEELQQEKYEIRLINNPDRITPKAMNIGIDEAKGDYIMIAGAHTTFPEKYISTLITFLENTPDASAAGSPLETKVNDKKPGHSIAKVMANKLGVGNSTFRTGTQNPLKVDTVPYGIYRKEVFDKVGRYNEHLIRNQDIEFSRRILRDGGKIYLVPGIKCDYYLRGSFLFLARSSFKNGLWNILTMYITKNPGSVSFRHLVPLFFILSLIIPVILAWTVNALFIYISALSFGLYLLTVLINSILLTDVKSGFFHVLWTHFVLHFSYGMGSLIGLLRFDKLLDD